MSSSRRAWLVLQLFWKVIVKYDVEDGHVRMPELKPSYREGSISASEELLLIQGQVPFVIRRPFIFSRHPQRVYWAICAQSPHSKQRVMSIEYSLA